MDKHSIVTADYYLWLVRQITPTEKMKKEYSRLLMTLFSTTFTWKLRGDANRAADGVNLRKQYEEEVGLDEHITSQALFGPCTILEMMAALALRCENSIMADDAFGNRTGVWFWKMIDNLGLTPYSNGAYDDDAVFDILARFLRREYTPDGKGGLFQIDNPPKNLRRVEIWYQMGWWLDRILCG